jgi:hypothetical protein
MEKLGMRVVGERRVDYMSVGLCSLPSSLRQAPEGKWALAGARLYLYLKIYMEKPELFVREQVAYFNV